MAGEAKPKPKCPECDTELTMVKDGDNIVPPEKCANCGFRLKGFEGFFRWLEAGVKMMQAKAKSKKPSPSQDDDFWSALGSL